MRVLLSLCLVAVGCLAQKPHPCRSPPLLTGNFVVTTQNEALGAGANFLYDGMGQRIRLQEMGLLNNKSFTLDALLLYREAAVYVIDQEKRKCTKKPLKDAFHPMEIPTDAVLLGQVVLGSSSSPGEGLLVNTWEGLLPAPGEGKYMSTVTEFGCIPVSSVFHTPDYGWVMISYFNNLKGITDPSMLNPPDFCDQAELQGDEVHFFSLFV